jgi:hypothetical protein
MRACGDDARLDRGRRPVWVNRLEQRYDGRDMWARHGRPGHELV